jgi:hypothetical protein
MEMNDIEKLEKIIHQQMISDALKLFKRD